MRLERTTKHSRCLLATDLPVSHPNDLAELEIKLNYTGDSNCMNAIPLDVVVVPEIVRRFNLHERMVMCLQNCLTGGGRIPVKTRKSIEALLAEVEV